MALPRRLLACAALTALGAATASGAPDVQGLADRARQATRAHARASAALDEQRAALAATRAQLDAAQTRYAARLESLRLRLRELYAQPTLSPILVAIAADPVEAQARADFVDVMAQHDAELVREYRDALVGLRAAEARLQHRKQALSAQTRILAARRARATARLNAARAELRPASPATPSVQGASTEGVTRGLPAEVLRDHTLPGAAPLDAATGRPLTFVPAARGALPVPDGPSRFRVRTGWYAPTLRRTASGELFNPQTPSAAHRTLPMGTLLRLTNGTRQVLVRVNDRGPYVSGRDLDVSPIAARILGLTHVTVVRAEVVTSSGG